MAANVPITPLSPLASQIRTEIDALSPSLFDEWPIAAHTRGWISAQGWKQVTIMDGWGFEISRMIERELARGEIL